MRGLLDGLGQEINCSNGVSQKAFCQKAIYRSRNVRTTFLQEKKKESSITNSMTFAKPRLCSLMLRHMAFVLVKHYVTVSVIKMLKDGESI